MDQIRQTQTSTNKVAQKTLAQRPEQYYMTTEKQKPSVVKILLIISAVILVLALIGGASFKLLKNKNNLSLIGVKSSQYQALFLTNGQVYFGKIEKADSKTVKISDIFYLQVQQTVQPKEDEDQKGETQLVKLGEELHGPEDEMFIDRSQVLFWENLKDNGKVVEAIKQYKK
ncbi:hypothetical protein KDA11_06040 [Candidatus Saccharibacteria bacterium]|nr:hypothetical protein [Candidatus Saccharibacteria bacterium]